MAKKPYKPRHLVKLRMISIRVSEEFSEWIYSASERHGISIADLMREGAQVYVKQLERKGGPRREKK